MRSKWTQSRPCARAAYLAFSEWPNSDARRMLRRLGVVQDETKKGWPIALSDAPDDRFWFRVPLTEKQDLQAITRILRANGMGASYGPYAGCGNIMAPTGAGVASQQSKPRNIRNAKFRALEQSGEIRFQTVIAHIFAGKDLPDTVSMMNDLNRIAWQETGAGFAQVKDWIRVIQSYLVEKQETDTSAKWVDAQTILERDYFKRLDEFGEEKLAPRIKPKKSETFPQEGLPIILAPEAKAKFHAHGKRKPRRTMFRWFEMESQEGGAGI